jgi:hypothetical protein
VVCLNVQPLHWSGRTEEYHEKFAVRVAGAWAGVRIQQADAMRRRIKLIHEL